ncbi:MAG: BMC domain-containing protein [Candidatus Zixiibacteriota bacterium]
MPREALGLIETRGMIGAIEVTHAATKAADLVIISAEQSDSGRVTVKIEGSWSSVLSAIEAGARAAEQAGQLVSMHLIGNPDENLSTILPYQIFLERYQPSDVSAAPRKIVIPKPVAPKVIKPSKPAIAKKPAAPQPVTPKPQPTKPAPAPKPQPVTQPAHEVTVTMPSMAELEAMPVVKLRQFARSLPNLPIQGRQISMANKTQLLEAIKAIHK